MIELGLGPILERDRDRVGAPLRGGHVGGRPMRPAPLVVVIVPGRVRRRERAGDGLVVVVAQFRGCTRTELSQRLDERRLGLGERDPVLRALRPRDARLDVAPSESSPSSLKPTTLGSSIETGWPSIAASASMPPTPQPSTPRPLIIVVCESVPTSVSGYARDVGPSWTNTTCPRYSRFTWWQIPVAGGTTRRLSNACCPQRRNA